MLFPSLPGPVPFLILAVFCGWSIAVAPFGVGQEVAEDDRPDAMQQQIQAITSHLNSCLVQIEMTGLDDPSLSRRTGVILDREGYLITHATGLETRPDTILVINWEGKQQIARWIATDQIRNLLLLKTDPLPVTAFCESASEEQIQVGQTVLALGKMLSPRQAHISRGIVSAKSRIWGKAIQTDAKISPLNYGGPLVDLRGRLVGILTPLSMNVRNNREGMDWYDSGIGFAVPLADDAPYLTALKQGKDIHRGLAGFEIAESNPNATRFPISAIHPGSPAYQQLEAGDQIVQIDGKSVENLAQFYDVYYQARAGQTLTFQVQRDQQILNVSLSLVDRLAPFQFQVIGCLVQVDDRGIVVLASQPESLQPGDYIEEIDGKPIRNIAQLRASLIGKDDTNPLTLQIQRDNQTMTVNVLPSKLVNWEPTPELVEPLVVQDPVPGTLTKVDVADLVNGATLWQPDRSQSNETSRPNMETTLILLRDSLQSDQAVLAPWKTIADRFGFPVLICGPQKEQWTSDDAACIELLIQQAETLLHPESVVARSSAVVLAIGDATEVADRLLESTSVSVDGLAFWNSEPPAAVLTWTNRPGQRLMVAAIARQSPEWITGMREHAVPVQFFDAEDENWQPAFSRWLIGTQVE